MSAKYIVKAGGDEYPPLTLAQALTVVRATLLVKGEAAISVHTPPEGSKRVSAKA